MAVMMIISFDVADAARFADYNPGMLPAIGKTLQTHGGKLAFIGPPDVIVGEARQTVVGIEFPDAEAGRAWLDDPEYAEALAIRLEATTNVSTYVLPLAE